VIVPRSCKRPFHSTGSFFFTQNQNSNDINYHHYYSPTPCRGPWAAEGRNCDASKSKAGHARAKRAST
jgi:hypothetical protein